MAISCPVLGLPCCLIGPSTGARHPGLLPNPRSLEHLGPGALLIERTREETWGTDQKDWVLLAHVIWPAQEGERARVSSPWAVWRDLPEGSSGAAQLGSESGVDWRPKPKQGCPPTAMLGAQPGMAEPLPSGTQGCPEGVGFTPFLSSRGSEWARRRWGWGLGGQGLRALRLDPRARRGMTIGLSRK